MVKDLIVLVKYPSAAGIIATVWLASTILIISQPGLPIIPIVVINIIATSVIAFIGFRVEKT